MTDLPDRPKLPIIRQSLCFKNSNKTSLFVKYAAAALSIGVLAVGPPSRGLVVVNFERIYEPDLRLSPAAQSLAVSSGSLLSLFAHNLTVLVHSRRFVLRRRNRELFKEEKLTLQCPLVAADGIDTVHMLSEHSEEFNQSRSLKNAARGPKLARHRVQSGPQEELCENVELSLLKKNMSHSFLQG